MADQTTRLLPSAFIAASGKRADFEYEALPSSWTAYGSVHSFPQADAQYGQRLGRSGGTYPLRMVFSGPDCDKLADNMEALLSENKLGTLLHPERGRIRVAVIGEVKRETNPSTAVWEIIIEATFHESLESCYPDLVGLSGANARARYQSVAKAAKVSLSKSLKVPSGASLVEARSTLGALLTAAQAGLTAARNAVTSAKLAANDVVSGIEDGMDLLIGQPLALGDALLTLICTPAEAANLLAFEGMLYAGQLRGLLASYRDLWESSRDAPLVSSGTQYLKGNQLALRDAMATAAASGAAMAVAGWRYRNREDALACRDALGDLVGDILAWRQGAYAELEDSDEGGVEAELVYLVATVQRLVEETAYDLPRTRYMVTPRDMTVIELAWRLRQNIGTEVIEELLALNDWPAHYVLLIPAGTKVRFYDGSL